MIVLRGLAFLFFLLLAAAMMFWQGHHLIGDFAAAWSPLGALALMGLGAGILVAEAMVWRAMSKDMPLSVTAIAGAPMLPVSSIIAGGVSLLQFRSGDHKRIWGTSFGINTLLTLNVMVPLVIGVVSIGGSPGLMAGWTAIKFQFFLVVDYFLFRAILHYFSSGASAFVSLRFLRKRIMSLLAVVGIMLGVLVLILVNSVMTGFQTDFREQMRGSLSHVLVRFRSEDIHARMRDGKLAQAEWAEFVRRIEADEEMTLPWNAALENALVLWRAQEKDALPDPAEFARMQPPPGPGDDGPTPDQPTETRLTDEEKAFLQRMRTGIGLSDFDRECLRDEGVIVTPRGFYLSRVGDSEKAEEEIRRAWYTPLFRADLKVQLDRADEALRKHTNAAGEPDIIGTAPRVSTKTFITPKSGSRELPIAELIGVDIEREPTISRLGEYVAAAELTDFRDQYALGPLLNILGATLGWETEDSIEATNGRREFMFTEDGKGTGRFPSDMTRTLASRRFTTASGRVRWRDFDNVRYLEFSPGRAIYERVREAYKEVARSEDPAQMGTLLKACHADIHAILLAHLKDNPADRFEQVNNTGAKVIFNEYLTGLGDAARTVHMFHADNASVLRTFITTNEGDAAMSAEIALAQDVLAQLDRATDRSEAEVKQRDVTEDQREQSLLALGNAYLKIYDDAIVRAEKLPTVLELLQNLRAASSDPEVLLMRTRHGEIRSMVPLGYAAEFFDEQAAAVQARMDAYRKVLPLRTAMRPGESADEYFERARTAGMRPERDKPGIILGDALADSALGAGVNVGDSIAVTIPRIYYEDGRLTPRTSEVWFRVTGFFRSGLYEENRGRMYCDFEELTSLLADSDVRYVLGAKLKDYRPYEGQYESDKLKQDLRNLLRENNANAYSVGVWEDETRTLLEAVNIERTLIGLIVSFIIVLAGGAIVIIVYQLVNEKVRDIGILKALGHSPWGIRSVFMFNALFIGLFGAILGCGAGMIVSEYLNEIEDLIDETTGIRLFPPDVYFLTYIPSVKGWELLKLAVDIAMPVVMFGFFCGILPSMAAARKDPVEALHYE